MMVSSGIRAKQEFHGQKVEPFDGNALCGLGKGGEIFSDFEVNFYLDLSRTMIFATKDHSAIDETMKLDPGSVCYGFLCWF